MKRYSIYYLLTLIVALAGCDAGGNFPGLEYAPQMYHTVPYEPLTQITDTTQGMWLSSLDNGVGEFYNSNPNNPYKMNSRVPPANTVRRNPNDFLPYRIPADSIELAARVLENPVDSSEVVLVEGKTLYTKFCYPCHGENGQGNGPVGVVYKGVPAYNKGRYVNMTEGHIFHTITHGRGRMNAHGSQIDVADRWKIVRYVQTLQQE
ncbi:MAG: cytochrome c [Bacteroidota bacterium]